MREVTVECRAGPSYAPAAVVAMATPSILLWDPKYPENVGAVVRTASCYGVKQVWQFGRRVEITAHSKDYRLPREERMRGYADVTLCRTDRPFDVPGADRAVFVAVEMRDNAERLPAFIHPADACYVFGPEDGSLGRMVLGHCRRFVVLPTRHCLNLASTVATVMYDRLAKQGAPHA